MQSFLQTIAISILVASVAGCSWVGSRASGLLQSSSKKPLMVRSQTDLPKLFRSKSAFVGPDREINIPRKMFNISQASRPKVEMRDGPGVQFALQDKILEKGDLIVEVDERGVWRKVISYPVGMAGWVHEKTIEKVSNQGLALKFNLNHLPTIITVEDIFFVHSFPEKKKLKTKIRRGSQFISFKRGVRSNLVWVSATNSVMWLPQEKVR